MRILLVTQQWSRLLSGVGTFCRQLARGLRDAGQQVSVLAPEEAGTPPEDLVSVPVRRVGWRLEGWGQQRWLPLAAAWARALRGPLAFDIVHFCDARESLLSSPTARWLGTVHDTYAAACPRWPWQLRGYRDAPLRWAYYRCSLALERRAYRRIPRLVANSTFTRASLWSDYGRMEAIPVVRNAVEPAPRLHVVDLEAGLRRPFRLAFSGGNPARKGLPLLREAAGLLARRFPLELWTFGFGQPRSERQGRLRIRHFGLLPRAEAWSCLAAADALALPSQVEALGLVLMEAMACGLPAIGSRLGGAAELLDDGREGLLVSPGDLNGLTRALAELILQPELRRRIGRAARARAARWTVPALAQRYLEVYGTL